MSKLLSVLVVLALSAFSSLNVALAEGGIEGVKSKAVDIKADVAAGKAGVVEIKQDIKDARSHSADDVNKAKAAIEKIGTEATEARDKVHTEAKPRN